MLGDRPSSTTTTSAHCSHAGSTSSHRLGLSYFHGRPGTPGYPEFDRAYESLQRNAPRIDRVQVTHAEMHELVVGAGVAPDRVFRIPIGVELERFPLGDETTRAAARAALDIPTSAFVVGSFLKDGVGMDEGLEPKLLKGPDTFVGVVSRLHNIDPRALRPAHRARTRLRQTRARSASASRIATPLSTRAQSSPARTTPPTSASSRQGRREARRPSSSRSQPACRS